MNTIYIPSAVPLQVIERVLEPETRVDVFEGLFLIFLGLGTIVGIIVIAYLLYTAYKYRDDGGRDDEDLPTLGELPTGGGSGKKLFVSFFLSALVVISLIVFSYGLLLQVEQGPEEAGEDAVEIDVRAFTFGFSYEYENGIESDTLVVPADETIAISATSTDVWHTFGIPQERVKADAIPGEFDETWFVADEPGEYEDAIECFELCGPGHSQMKDTLIVMSPDEYDAWVAEQLDLHVTVLDAGAEADEDEEDEPQPYTGDFEAEIVHNDTGETFTFDQDDVDENGTYTIGDIEQGGTFQVTVTPADDGYQVHEEEFDHTGDDGGVTLDVELQPVEDEAENGTDEGNGGDE